MKRLILTSKNHDNPDCTDLDNLSYINYIDRDMPHLLLIEIPEDKVESLKQALVNWTIAEEVIYHFAY